MLIRAIQWAVLIGFILCQTSCGYRNGGLHAPRTITVPYVEGDYNGDLTAAIVRQIVGSGRFSYRNECGALILKVKVLDLRDENIGFRYDRHKDGELKKSTIPVETRSIALVEVSVVEAGTAKLLLGPARLSTDIDFDHFYYSNLEKDDELGEGVNVFSLGQLTDIDEAHDAAERPLNYKLAQKIVDYLSQCL